MNYKKQEDNFCGKVPLHQTNLLQPHGVLLVVQKNDFGILQVGENAAVIFGHSAKELIGKSLSDFVTPQDKEELQSLASRKSVERLPLKLTINGQTYLSLLHSKPDCLVVEIELNADKLQTTSFTDIYRNLKSLMAEVEQSASVADAADAAIRELKRITGFDKVMVYQFDKDWHGTVIAEAAEEGMDLYLGLRFPATDIPKQARQLYFKNPYRFLPDVNYAPVKIYPLLNPQTHTFTDLADTNLRSVAPVHIEYLKNMGVSASLSARILHEGELWGLIACHHRTPKHLSYETCFLFELVCGFISSKISTLYKSDSAAYNAKLLADHGQLAQAILTQGSVVEAISQNQEPLLHLLNAGGAALVSEKRISLFGQTPSLKEVEDLFFWVRSNSETSPFYTDQLSEVYPEAADFTNTASGFMSLPVQPDKDTYLLAFRPEVVEEVKWGGDPNKTIIFQENKTSYSPRNSFSVWQEQVRGTSEPWLKEEKDAAERFRNFLVEYAFTQTQSD